MARLVQGHCQKMTVNQVMADKLAEVESRAVSQRAKENGLGREYEVRTLSRKDFAQWEKFVMQSPQGTLFHTPLWLEAVDAPFRLFGCFRGTELHGGCVVGLLGHRIAGPSILTPYLGILYPQTSAKYVTKISTQKGIAAAFAAFLKKEFDLVQIRFVPEVVDVQPFIWEGFEAGVRYTYRLSLGSLDAVLENMDSRRRNDLTAAERQGTQIETGAAFEDVMKLSELTFQRQRLPVTFGRPTAERVEMVLRKAGRCMSFLARRPDGAALGAVWIVWDDKRAYYLLGGYDDSAKSNNAMALALWRAIQFTATDLHLQEFDFEGSMIPAVERFFRKFGGTLTPTYTVQYRRPIGLGRRVARKLVQIVGERR
jgi:Acetyltransferase (GNAT) domain